MSEPKFVIVIPARYGSSRFPGKPLHVIAGKPMLQWVYERAYAASQQMDKCQVIVATDDNRIATFAQEQNMAWVMTDSRCKTGSDRVKAAIETLEQTPDFVINLQGDSPLTPVHYLTDMMQAVIAKPSISIATLAVQLTWESVDQWRAHKEKSPSSGTSVVFDKTGRALWFSKTIIPFVRDEAKRRESEQASPVYKHIGIYGYTPQMLNTFTRLQQTTYEQVESLEQLRFVENGYAMQVVVTQTAGLNDSLSVDTPEDAIAVERILLASQNNNNEIA